MEDAAALIDHRTGEGGSDFREGPCLSQSNKVKQNKFREKAKVKVIQLVINHEFQKSQEKDFSSGLGEIGGERQKHGCAEPCGDQTGTDEGDHGIPAFLWW